MSLRACHADDWTSGDTPLSLRGMENPARPKDQTDADARLEAELTRYLEAALSETTPPRLIELARELQRRLRDG